MPVNEYKVQAAETSSTTSAKEEDNINSTARKFSETIDNKANETVN